MTDETRHYPAGLRPLAVPAFTGQERTRRRELQLGAPEGDVRQVATSASDGSWQWPQLTDS